MDSEPEKKPQSTSPPLTPPACSPDEDEWILDIFDALNWTDGIEEWTHREVEGEVIITINYGDEAFEFTAGNDGEVRGAKYDGGVHDLTDSEKVQWWISCQLYDRLQRARRDLREANLPLTHGGPANE